MTETKTRTPVEQRKVAASDCWAALKDLDQIRYNAREMSRKLADLVNDVDRASQLVMDSLGWLQMEPDAIHDEIADRPDDFPPVA